MDSAATIRRLYDLINAGNIDGFGDMLAEDFIEHEQMPGISSSKAGAQEFFRMYLAAFPDLHFRAETVLVSGDTAVARLWITGTQRRDFMGMPATGKEIEVEAIDIVRFGEDGLAHEHWGITDALSMMHQLGAVPEPAMV
jgi:steroid delta-isomerase-like uncharacterized protein